MWRFVTHPDGWRCDGPQCQRPAGRRHHGCEGEAGRVIWRDGGEALTRCPLSAAHLGPLAPLLKPLLRFALFHQLPLAGGVEDQSAVFADALDATGF